MKELTREYADELDNNYFNGMEDGVLMVKRLFEFTPDERYQYFGDVLVANILDKFDFQKIHEILSTIKNEPEKELHSYYIIRGIRVREDGVKKVVAESDKLTMKPDELLINVFMNANKHRNISFSCVEKIYVLE